MVHVAWRRSLLLSLSDINGLYLRRSLRRLSPLLLSLRRYASRSSLRRPFLRVAFLHRTTMRGSTHLILWLGLLLRWRLGLSRLLNGIEAEGFVIERWPWERVLSSRAGRLPIVTIVPAGARPCDTS